MAEAGGTADAVAAPRCLVPVDGVPYGVDLQPPLARARLGTLDWSGMGGLRCPVENLAVAAAVDGAAAVDCVVAVDGVAVDGVAVADGAVAADGAADGAAAAVAAGDAWAPRG